MNNIFIKRIVGELLKVEMKSAAIPCYRKSALQYKKRERNVYQRIIKI